MNSITKSSLLNSLISRKDDNLPKETFAMWKIISKIAETTETRVWSEHVAVVIKWSEEEQRRWGQWDKGAAFQCCTTMWKVQCDVIRCDQMFS